MTSALRSWRLACPPANSRGDVEADQGAPRIRRVDGGVPRRIAGVTLKPGSKARVGGAQAECPPANSRGDVEAATTGSRNPDRRGCPPANSRGDVEALSHQGGVLGAHRVPRRIAGVTLKHLCDRGLGLRRHRCPPANSRGDVEARWKAYRASAPAECPPANSRGDVEARGWPITSSFGLGVPRRIAGVTLKPELADSGVDGALAVSPGE